MLLPMPDLPIKNKKFLLVEIWNDMRDDVVEGAEEPHTPKGPHAGNDGRAWHRHCGLADLARRRRETRPATDRHWTGVRCFAHRERDKSLDI